MPWGVDMAFEVWVHTVTAVPSEVLNHFKLTVKDYLNIIGYAFTQVVDNGDCGYMLVNHEIINWMISTTGYEHYITVDAEYTELLLDVIGRELAILESRRPEDTSLVEILSTSGQSLYLTVHNETDSHTL